MDTNAIQRSGQPDSHGNKRSPELVAQGLEGWLLGKDMTQETLTLTLNNDEIVDDWEWLEDEALDTFMDETLGGTNAGHPVKYERAGELEE